MLEGLNRVLFFAEGVTLEGLGWGWAFGCHGVGGSFLLFDRWKNEIIVNIVEQAGDVDVIFVVDTLSSFIPKGWC